MFETRNAKYIYVGGMVNASVDMGQPYSKGALLRQQTVAYVAPKDPQGGNKGFDLWLLCPPWRERTDLVHMNRINTYSQQRHAWINKSNRERNLYR